MGTRLSPRTGRPACSHCGVSPTHDRLLGTRPVLVPAAQTDGARPALARTWSWGTNLHTEEMSAS